MLAPLLISFAHLSLAAPAADTTLPMTCMPRSAMLTMIKDRFKGVPVFVGIASVGRVLEVWRDTVSPGDHWVAFLSQPDGSSCIVVEGLGMSVLNSDVADKT